MQPFALTLVSGVAPSVSRMLFTLLSNESQLYAVVKPTYEYLISTGFHTDCTGCAAVGGRGRVGSLRQHGGKHARARQPDSCEG